MDQFIINTDTSLESLPKKSVSVSGVLQAAASIPLQFSWQDPITGKNFKDKKTGLTLPLYKPQSQGICGSCWAFSTASVLSDVYVVAQYRQQKNIKGLPLGKNDKIVSPDASAFYILVNTYKIGPWAQGCNGGAPADLVKWIGEKGNGVKSNHCIDYTAISNVPSSSKEKGDALNSMIIPAKGKCVTDSSHILISLDEKSIFKLDPKDVHVDVLKLNLRTHIFNKGPIVTGFTVMKNFMPLSLNKIKDCFKDTDSAYYDIWNYAKKKPLTLDQINDNIAAPAGGHAVTIVGYTKRPVPQKVVDALDKLTGLPFYQDWPKYKTSNTKNGTLTGDFWVLRNSWGSDWATNGYTYYPIYPIVAISSLELPFKGSDGKIHSSGPVYFDVNLGDGIKLIPASSSNTSLLPAPFYDTIKKEKGFYDHELTHVAVNGGGGKGGGGKGGGGKGGGKGGGNGGGNGGGGSSTSRTSLSTGAIIGICVGSIAFVAIVVLIIMYTMKKGKKGKRRKKKKK